MSLLVLTAQSCLQDDTLCKDKELSARRHSGHTLICPLFLRPMPLLTQPSPFLSGLGTGITSPIPMAPRSKTATLGRRCVLHSFKISNISQSRVLEICNTFSNLDPRGKLQSSSVVQSSFHIFPVNTQLTKRHGRCIEIITHQETKECFHHSPLYNVSPRN